MPLETVAPPATTASSPGFLSSRRWPGEWRPRCRTRSTLAISCRTASSASSTRPTASTRRAASSSRPSPSGASRGAMIDALRKDAWPRGVRRQRRELEAAREQLRRENGCEPSIADLAAKLGSDEKRLSRTIVRIATIESTSPLATSEHVRRGDAARGAAAVGARAARRRLRAQRGRGRVRAAIEALPRARAEGRSASTTTAK